MGKPRKGTEIYQISGHLTEPLELLSVEVSVEHFWPESPLEYYTRHLCVQGLFEGITSEEDSKIRLSSSRASQAKDIEGDLSGSKSINDPSMYRVYVEQGRTNEISSTSTKDEGAMTSLEGGLRETIAKEEA
ncbi:hypothetical protein RIR_jg40416.t1 [Rhizophagus irregularis DAOM 181602=DAOM 197198]|nr:hypothetical protein RIR_jg40416.t1 [Rhizophagus irregularis DAOM 181602=DAOM 197198]